jgi:hypothetical protein
MGMEDCYSKMCVPSSVPSGKQLLAKFVLNSGVFLVFLAACIHKLLSTFLYPGPEPRLSILHRFIVKKERKKLKTVVGSC